jgi:hypothetical protein
MAPQVEVEPWERWYLWAALRSESFLYRIVVEKRGRFHGPWKTIMQSSRGRSLYVNCIDGGQSMIGTDVLDFSIDEPPSWQEPPWDLALVDRWHDASGSVQEGARSSTTARTCCRSPTGRCWSRSATTCLGSWSTGSTRWRSRAPAGSTPSSTALRVSAQALRGHVAHYRDNTGLEVDAIVEIESGTWGAFEIKLGGPSHRRCSCESPEVP